MKKILIPVSMVALVLLVGAGCYAKKATNTDVVTNDSSTVNTDTTFDTLNLNDDTNTASDLNTNTATTNANSNTNSATNTNASTNTNTASTAPSTAGVSIANFAFSPTSVSVKQGGTVTFTNNDSVAHTVKVTGQADQSIAAGDTYTLATSTLTVGAHSYSCSIHPSMTGTINVVQ